MLDASMQEMSEYVTVQERFLFGEGVQMHPTFVHVGKQIRRPAKYCKQQRIKHMVRDCDCYGVCGVGGLGLTASLLAMALLYWLPVAAIRDSLLYIFAHYCTYVP